MNIDTVMCNKGLEKFSIECITNNIHRYNLAVAK